MIIRYTLTFVFCILLTFLCNGQTKIAVPSATVQFDNLKFSKKQKKAERKRLRFRKKKVRNLKRLIRKNTSLDKQQVEKYKVVFHSMDSAELKQLHQDLHQLAEEKAPSEVSEGYNLVTVANIDSTSVNHIPDVFIENYEGKLTDAGIDTSMYKGLVKHWTDSSTYSSIGDSVKNKSQPDSVALRNNLNHLAREKAPSQVHDGYNLARNANLDSTTVNSDSISSQELVNRAGLDTSSISSRITNHMESLLKEKVKENLSGLEAQPDDIQSHVKQYIPSIEKFNYEKPEIPKDKLDDAIVQQYKERKVQELKDGLSIKKANDYGQADKNAWSRFSIGGYMRYDAAKQSIELTPVLTFAITPKILLGGGYQTNISLTGSDSLNTRGFRVFAEYFFLDSYFIHGESEWIRQKGTGEGSNSVSERNTYLGIGRTFQYKFIKTSVLALYNFNAPSELRTKKFSIRIGLTIGK